MARELWVACFTNGSSISESDWGASELSLNSEAKCFCCLCKEFFLKKCFFTGHFFAPRMTFPFKLKCQQLHQNHDKNSVNICLKLACKYSLKVE